MAVEIVFSRGRDPDTHQPVDVVSPPIFQSGETFLIWAMMTDVNGGFDLTFRVHTDIPVEHTVSVPDNGFGWYNMFSSFTIETDQESASIQVDVEGSEIGSLSTLITILGEEGPPPPPPEPGVDYTILGTTIPGTILAEMHTVPGGGVFTGQAIGTVFSGQIVTITNWVAPIYANNEGYQELSFTIPTTYAGKRIRIVATLVEGEEEEPPDGDGDGDIPEIALVYFRDLGYNDSQAMALANYFHNLEGGGITPTPELALEVFNTHFIDVDDEEKAVIDRLLELDDEERATLLEAEDTTEEERSWLSQILWGLDFEDPDIKMQHNTVPFSVAGGVGATAAVAGSGRTLGILKGFLTKGKSALKWGLGIGVMKKVGNTWVKKTTIGSVLASPFSKAAGAAAATDGMMVWLASDNILGGGAFLTNKLLKAVEEKVITNPSDIQDRLNSIETWMGTATSLVDTSSMINPLLMPFRGVLMANVEETTSAFNLDSERIWNAHDSQQGGPSDQIKLLRAELRGLRSQWKTEDLALKEERISVEHPKEREIEEKKEQIEAGGDKDALKLEIDDIRDDINETRRLEQESDIAVKRERQNIVNDINSQIENLQGGG